MWCLAGTGPLCAVASRPNWQKTFSSQFKTYDNHRVDRHDLVAHVNSTGSLSRRIAANVADHVDAVMIRLEGDSLPGVNKAFFLRNPRFHASTRIARARIASRRCKERTDPRSASPGRRRGRVVVGTKERNSKFVNVKLTISGILLTIFASICSVGTWQALSRAIVAVISCCRRWT